MRAGVVWRIFLAAEGPSDVRRIQALVDHFLQERTGKDASVTDLRRFEGLGGGESYIPIKSIPLLAKARGLDRRYSAEGLKHGDAGTLRKLYQVLQKDKLLGPGTVILWARDDDGNPDRASTRQHQANEARDALPSSTPLLLAIATECGEAWVIAGWKPSADDPKLKLWRRKLGFAPHERSWELSHKAHAPKSAKAVLEDIFGGEEEKEAAALISAARSQSEASLRSGLQAFCEDVRSRWLK